MRMLQFWYLGSSECDLDDALVTISLNAKAVTQATQIL